MKIKVLGVGAAGNKGTINLITKNILEQSRILLINSTVRDIPENYRSVAVTYSNSKGGCGKERDLASELCLNSIKDQTLSILDSFVDPDDDLVIIAASTEGGTGSGSIKILAKYFTSVIGKPVMVFGFSGFEEDGRGLQNTIEYFQDLEEGYIVQCISNKKFLDEAFGNKIKAEKLANDEFAKRVSVLVEQGIIDSEQNIDHTDMVKSSTTPGFMTINKSNLGKIKNIEQFNKLVTEMLDNDKSLDTAEKSQKRLAVFINAKEETLDYIDYGFEVLKSKLGMPYEVFTHIQYNEEEPEYISTISSGMKMPLDELKEVYEKYKEQSEKVNKKKDDFFSFASELKGNQDDIIFNSANIKQNTISAESFLDSFKKDDKKIEKNKSNNDNNIKQSKKDFININY